MDEAEFNVGDVVQLKSGGARMTVIKVGWREMLGVALVRAYESDPDAVICTWHCESGRPMEQTYPSDALMPYVEPAPYDWRNSILGSLRTVTCDDGLHYVAELSSDKAE